MAQTLDGQALAAIKLGVCRQDGRLAGPSAWKAGGARLYRQSAGIAVWGCSGRGGFEMIAWNGASVGLQLVANGRRYTTQAVTASTLLSRQSARTQHYGLALTTYGEPHYLFLCISASCWARYSFSIEENSTFVEITETELT